MADELTVEEIKRLELSAKLHELLGSDNVYYQPPPSTQMHYPCIRYKRTNDAPIYADNETYIQWRSYEIMVISRNPVEPVVDLIPKNFKYCRMSKSPYVADNLHHVAFTIYW